MLVILTETKKIVSVKLIVLEFFPYVKQCTINITIHHQLLKLGLTHNG